MEEDAGSSPAGRTNLCRRGGMADPLVLETSSSESEFKSRRRYQVPLQGKDGLV